MGKKKGKRSIASYSFASLLPHQRHLTFFILPSPHYHHLHSFTFSASPESSTVTENVSALNINPYKNCPKMTTSPKNFKNVKTLGAAEVFDYNSPTVVPDLVNAFKGKEVAGIFDAVGAWGSSVEIIQHTAGVKFIASSLRGFPDPPEGITMKQVQSFSIKDNHVGKAIFEDFLPKALESGSFVPAPEPQIVGKGLESIQAGVDIVREGISGKKLVVTLP